MRHPIFHASFLTGLFGLILFALLAGSPQAAAGEKSVAQKRLLYVAVPGIRDYLEYGGHGILIFDIEDGHKFVKRFPSAGVDEKGKPLNVKGICASSRTGRLYVSTTKTR